MNELAAETSRTLGAADSVPDGSVTPYYLNDRKLRVSVAHVGERLYAFDDLCTCPGVPCPLSAGLLTGTTLMCQCHGSRFDIATGAVVDGPASAPLQTYEVQLRDGQIQIRA
jgi:3-phenylpropionate/trans-cinnamate dioxygenase ferredoxin component